MGRDEPLARSVREAGVGDLAQVSATLADAFTTDPILQWLAPSQRSDRRLRRLIGIELAYYVFPAGRVLTTADFSGANPSCRRQVEMSVPLSAAIGSCALGLRLPRARRLQLPRASTQEPHYYIRYLGVATRFQGQGIGTALLRPTLDRCDAEGVAAYLEASTERSAALYERLGFIHLGELRVPDGPRFWPMRRPPAVA